MVKEALINTLFMITLMLTIAGWFIHIAIAIAALMLFIPLFFIKAKAIVSILKKEEDIILDEKEKH